MLYLYLQTLQEIDYTHKNDYFHVFMPGFYGTYLVYGHADVLLGPYSDRTFRVKDVMYRGLQPSMASEEIRYKIIHK